MAKGIREICYNMLLDSSDDDNDDDDIENIDPHFMIDDDFDIENLMPPILQGIVRMQRIKIINYIENQARNYNENDFIMHFRLSREVTYTLVNRFEGSPVFTSLRGPAGFEPTSPEKHILCYLWFVGHQTASYRDVADRFGVTLSTLYKIISRVTTFLMSIAPNIIKFPTPEERNLTKQHYLQKKDFPGIIGSIDGSHIRLDKPLYDKDSYINRKQYFSIQMQCVVDHRKKFIDVFIGYPGSVHDARVFRESSLFNNLDNICGRDGFLLGDTAYPCIKRLIVPYKDNGRLTRAQRNFNQKLSSCRVVVENAFGCLKQRFRQLYHIKLRNMIRIVQVIHACCVLHNIANENDLRLFDEPIADDYPDDEARNIGIYDIEEIEDNNEGRHLRDEICRQLAMQ